MKRSRSSRRSWRREAAALEIADAAMVDTLESLEDAENYRNWILELSASALQGANHVLEVGAGRGTFTSELARERTVTAVEPGQNAARLLQQRYRESANVEVVQGELDCLPDSSFDVAFLSNVLEHIQDDVGALTELTRVVRAGGRVIVFSPAFPLLYSRFDARIGHHHRYRLTELTRRFETAGMTVVEARYVNSLGFFSWLLLVRLLGATPENRRLVRLFDRSIVPVLRRLERRWRPAFGQSVFVVGRV